MDKESTSAMDWATMRGHYLAKRVLEVAASGNHALLLVGPSHSGKTTIARSLMTILPNLPFLELASNEASALLAQAGSGIVFLPHLERWSDSLLANLRKMVVQSLGQILLIATTSYCPCGNYTDEANVCTCSKEVREMYQRRLRQPIDACFALEVYIPSVNRFASIQYPDEPSSAVRQRVEAARRVQYQRNGEARLNTVLSLPELEQSASLDAPSQMLLAAAHRQLSLSPEQDLYLRQVTRTLTDLANEDVSLSRIKVSHLAESISYRPRWRTKS